MKIYLASDLHLEFADVDIKNTDDVDVLILSGDIIVAADLGKCQAGTTIESVHSQRYREFFMRVSQEFRDVIYVMGNHEHYSGNVVKTQGKIQDMLDHAGIYNVHLLENDCRDINGTRFIGGTLWTNMNREDALTLFHASSSMNDYHGVRNGNRKFVPADTVEFHRRTLQYIDTFISNRSQPYDRVVVVGHHAPSFSSVGAEYANSHLMNGCYASDLSDFILDRPEIDLWTHGHTHEEFDYMVGTCRVVCNPRGYYGYEPRAHQWTPKLIELESRN